MRNTKKLFALILAMVMSLTLLTGCGKPDGKYYLNDSYGNMYIEFSGKNIVVSALGMSLSGTYKIKGNQISIKTNVLGYNSETTYSFSKSGNTITFEGRTFVKNSSGRMSPFTVFIIVLLLAIGGGAAFYFKKRQKEGRVFTPEEREELANKVNSASRTIAKTASVAGLKTAKVVSAGVTVGVAASKTGFNMAKEAVKNYQANKQMRDEQKMKTEQFFAEWEEISPEADTWEEIDDTDEYQIDEQEPAVGPDSSTTDVSSPVAVEEDEWEEESPPPVPSYTGRHSAASQKASEPLMNTNAPTVKTSSTRKNLCCICGRELGEDATRIAGLPSGEEVYIDRLCHKMLQIIATTDKPEEFQSASKYIRAHINYVDPVLAQSLTQFIGKGETRLHLK